ncbi:MAG: hypothetical protein QHH75_07940 [Bacillota bacterium]|nr:hypothetical protein [Bacillota bacterium]
MLLTDRQREFLSHIFDHYLKHKSPVHYTAVAQWLGVSKWTAYDMLKRLGQDGYLAPHYAVNEKGNPGRSLLFYVPTPKLARLLGRGEEHQQENWLAWKKRILASLEKLREAGSHKGNALVDELTALLPEAEGPTMYCACLLAVFVAYLKTVNEQGMRLVRQVMNLITKPDQRLSLLSGTIVGIVSKDSQDSQAAEPPGEKEGGMAGFIDKFHQYLARIDLKQHRLLATFLDDLLQAVC